MVDGGVRGDEQREQLAIEIAEGMSAVALVKALVLKLNEKGVLTNDDIAHIEANADRFFADDLKSLGDADT